MKKMGNMTYYTLEECLDEHFGVIGTPKRDKFEAEVAEAVQAYHMGEAIKQARKSKKLTQEQLGELIGVKRAQVSKIEKGRNLNFSTLSRVLKSMNIPANINIEGVGTVALW